MCRRAVQPGKGTRMPDGSRMTPAVSDAVLTVPNAISFARLCAVPLAVWLVLNHQLAEAFWLFIVAGASDAVDGWLARRGGGSTVGAVLDPLADKALMIGMYVTLAAVNALPDWLAILVVFRDLLIVGGVLALVVMGQPVTIRPLAISKLNTALQIVLVAVTLFLAGFALVIPLVQPVLIWAVAMTTLASGGAYVWAVAQRQ